MRKSVAVCLVLLALTACARQLPRLPPAPLPQQQQPQVALPPAPPPGEPVGIVGLEEDQLRAVFGEPAFIRKDGTAQMWRYDSPGCKAFFFLYPAYGMALAVRHVETVPRGGGMAADAGCLAALRSRPATPAS